MRLTPFGSQVVRMAWIILMACSILFAIISGIGLLLDTDDASWEFTSITAAYAAGSVFTAWVFDREDA